MYSVTYFFPCRSLRQRANRMMDLVIYYMDIDLQSKLELAGGRWQVAGHYMDYVSSSLCS